MMIAIDVSTVKIFGWPMLITRMMAAITPITTAGMIGVWVFGIDASELLAEGKCVVARHGEGQPDGGRVHGQRADRDRDDDADQEDLAQRAPHDLLDDVLQAAAALADLRVVQVGRGHHREHQDARRR